MKTAADKSKNLNRAAKSKHNLGSKNYFFFEKAEKKVKKENKFFFKR